MTKESVVTIPPEATPSEALALFDACATPTEDRNGSSTLVAKCKCGGQRYQSFQSDREIPCAEITSIIHREIRIGDMSTKGIVPHCRNFARGSWIGETCVAAEVFAEDFGLEVQPYSGRYDALGRKHCDWYISLDRGEYQGLLIPRSDVENEEFPHPFVEALRGDNHWYLQTDIDKWWERVLFRSGSHKPADKIKGARRECPQGYIYLVFGEPIEKAGLIGYIGQTVDYEGRRYAHLVKGDQTTAALMETFRAKGVAAQMKVVRRCAPKALNAEEARWYRTYKESGWILWNRTELKEISD